MNAHRSRPGPHAGLIVLIAAAVTVLLGWGLLLLIGAIQP